jgi:AraC-like DNA-binding protein
MGAAVPLQPGTVWPPSRGSITLANPGEAPRFISTALVESRLRTEVWRKALAPLACMIPSAPAPVLASYVTYRLGRMVIVRSTTSAGRYTREKVAADSDVSNRRDGFGAYCMAQIIVRGSMTGRFGQAFVSARRGDICCASLDQGADLQYGDSEHVSLFVPRAVLGDRVENLHGRILREGQLGCRMLTGHLMRLMGELSKARTDLARDIASRTADVLKACLGHAAECTGRPGQHPSLQQQVFSYIDENIDDPDLGPSALAAAFAISRSQLYRLFECHGGIHKYLLDCRLQAAFSDLSRNPDQQISDVVYRHGFSGERQFQRGFRKRFGMTSSELRRSQAAKHRLHGSH